MLTAARRSTPALWSPSLVAGSLIFIFCAGCYSERPETTQARSSTERAEIAGVEKLPLSEGSLVAPEEVDGATPGEVPADLPQYPGWTVMKGGAYAASGGFFSFKAVTKDPPQDVIRELRKQALEAGWKEKRSKIPNDIILELEKPGRTLTIALMERRGSTEILMTTLTAPSRSGFPDAPSEFVPTESAEDDRHVHGTAPDDVEEDLPDDLPVCEGWRVEHALSMAAVEKTAAFGGIETFWLTAFVEAPEAKVAEELRRNAKALQWNERSVDAWSRIATIFLVKGDYELTIHLHPSEKGTRVSMSYVNANDRVRWFESADAKSREMLEDVLEEYGKKFDPQNIPPEIRNFFDERTARERHEKLKNFAQRDRRRPVSRETFPKDVPSYPGWQVTTRDLDGPSIYHLRATAPAEIQDVAGEMARQARAFGWELKEAEPELSDVNEAQKAGLQNFDSYRLEFTKPNALLTLELIVNDRSTVVDIRDMLMPATPGADGQMGSGSPPAGPISLPGMPDDLPTFPGLRVLSYKAYDDVRVHSAKFAVDIDANTAKQQLVSSAVSLGWRQTACPVKDENGLQFEKNGQILAASFVFERQPTPIEVMLKPNQRSIEVNIEMMRFPRHPLPPKGPQTQSTIMLPEACPRYPGWILGPDCGVDPDGKFRVAASTTDSPAAVEKVLIQNAQNAGWMLLGGCFLKDRVLPYLAWCRKKEQKLIILITPEPGKTNIWMVCSDWSLPVGGRF